jgi:hypothetical protein
MSINISGFIIRTYCSDFANLQEGDWTTGRSLNTDSAAAIECQHKQIDALGLDGFYMKQRGLLGDAETQEYNTAVEFIQCYLNVGMILMTKYLT